jgi:hypothetical protein
MHSMLKVGLGASETIHMQFVLKKDDWYEITVLLYEITFCIYSVKCTHYVVKV